MNSSRDQIHQAFRQIIEEATPSTPSGSHKVVVIGQLVLNLPGDTSSQTSTKARPCCGKCHN